MQTQSSEQAILIKKYTPVLETIFETDQQAIRDVRVGKITVSDHAEINRKNVEIVKGIIAEMGFPRMDLISKKAYLAAVLVVLHSGDVGFLNQSILTLQKADPASRQKRDIAYMIDKVRVIEKRPQLYGTQYHIDKDGVFKYIEIEKPDELEKRRAEYEMESFEEYRKIVARSLGEK